jgi:hypothetical protein
MNSTFLFFCTPDLYRPTAKRSLEKLKNTRLDGIELVILDNNYDPSFRHPVVMQQSLDFAGGAPAVFMDDDVYISDPDWFCKLTDTAKKTGAGVVGCHHTYSSGETNHLGAIVYADGTTELIREKRSETKGGLGFVPAVSSALVYLPDSKALSFDTGFEKYQHDLDICLSAWQQGSKVSLSYDLTVVHELGDYMSKRPGFRDCYERDTLRFETKWASFASETLYKIEELKPFAGLSGQKNWERAYNNASRLSEGNPEQAAALFRTLVKECPFQWRRAGALYHLYLLEGSVNDLKECHRLNPLHGKAREEINRIEG